MNSNTFHLSIGEIGNTGFNRQHKLMPSDCLHYCPASAGGWGIVRVGLLVPESVMLLVSPAGCGRHGAIAALQLGFKERLFLLHVKETDIITGQHLEKIPQAVIEILAAVRPRPKAMLICATCIDDLFGSDYEWLARQLESVHGILVRICHMDPIAMDGKTPPPLTVQQAIYDFLEQPAEKERAVNIIGSFAPIDSESEFYQLMAAASVSRVRHIAACATLEEFRLMNRAKYNLLIKPGGHLAVQHMQKKLGIPYCSTPVAYNLATIARTYHILEQLLDVKLNTGRYREEAAQTAISYRKLLGPLTVSVGSTANASPFELARALSEYGFHVRYIFADLVLDFDLEHIEWLRHHHSHIKVFTNAHPTMVNFVKQELSADLAIGFDAGYFCSSAKTVPLSLDKQPFGYQAVTYLLGEMHKALDNTQSHREQMYASGMVI